MTALRNAGHPTESNRRPEHASHALALRSSEHEYTLPPPLAACRQVTGRECSEDVHVAGKEERPPPPLLPPWDRSTVDRTVRNRTHGHGEAIFEGKTYRVFDEVSVYKLKGQERKWKPGRLTSGRLKIRVGEKSPTSASSGGCSVKSKIVLAGMRLVTA